MADFAAEALAGVEDVVSQPATLSLGA